MLARSFLSASDLHMTEVERDALITVLGMLERGELIFSRWFSPVVVNGPRGFSMAVCMAKTSCGAIGCLCGWANEISNGAAFANLHKLDFVQKMPEPLIRLFRFDAPTVSSEDIEPEQAAQALMNFLTSGEARWMEVLFPQH